MQVASTSAILTLAQRIQVRGLEVLAYALCFLQDSRYKGHNGRLVIPVWNDFWIVLKLNVKSQPFSNRKWLALFFFLSLPVFTKQIILTMIDIKFLVKNPDVVRENIKKKYQDNKLPLVDEAINLYTQYCDCQQRADDLRSQRNSISKEIGILFKNKEVEKANEMKKVGTTR